jgi:hypothetical protein
MPVSIDSFRSFYSSSNEVSKADKFDVFISLPQQVAQGSGYGIAELAMQCEVSELPGKDVIMIEYRHYGFTKRIPHMNQYNHINFSFYCTGDLVEKKLFDRWMDLLIPADTGLVNYPEDAQGNRTYEADIQVNQYDQQGNMIYQVTLIDAIPTSMTPMGQNWNDDSVHRLNVSFAYRKWTSDQTAYGAAQSSTSPIQTNFSNLATSPPPDMPQQPPAPAATPAPVTPPTPQPTGPILPGASGANPVDYGDQDLSNPLGFG